MMNAAIREPVIMANADAYVTPADVMPSDQR